MAIYGIWRYKPLISISEGDKGFKMIKKLLIKVGIIVGILVAVPYYFYGGGRMPDFLQDFGWGGAESEKPRLPENISNVVTDKAVTVYKWVDENGIQHFGSTPPVGVVAETKHLKPNQNIMQAIKIPEKEEEEKTSGPKVTNILKNPYSKKNVEELIDNAKGVQDMLDKRFEDQQKMLDEMN